MMERLISCEYPFIWHPRTQLETIPDNMLDRLSEQINEKDYGEDFYFQYSILYIALAYEHGYHNRLVEALEALETGENKLNEFIPPKNIDEALRHILFSTKVYLLLQKGDADTATSVMDKVPLVDTMDKETKAALNGLRASFFEEYGINGTKFALVCATQAIELNPKESLWYFLKGKYLGRIRRVEQPFCVPETEEVKNLEKAVQIKPNASYLLFTAQLYRESASRMYFNHRINGTFYGTNRMTVNSLNEKSLELYDKGIDMRPDCPYAMFRCAKGYILFPPYFRTKRLGQAKTLLDKGLAAAPESGYGNHVMAQYYTRVEKDPETAIKYLKICEKKKIFGAAMDSLRLEYQMDKNIDVSHRLIGLLDIYPEKYRKRPLYSQLVSYHLFILDDVETACLYATEVLRIDPHCDDMMKHRPICLLHEPFNLWEVLVDELKIQMQSSKLADKIMKDYDKLLRDLMNAGVKLALTRPQHLKDQFIANSNERKEELQKPPNTSRNESDKKPYHQRFQKNPNAGQNEPDRKPYQPRLQKYSNASQNEPDRKPYRQGFQKHANRPDNEAIKKPYRQIFQQRNANVSRNEMDGKPYRQGFQKHSNRPEQETNEKPYRQWSEQRYSNVSQSEIDERPYRQGFQRHSNASQSSYRPPSKPDATNNRILKKPNTFHKNDVEQNSRKKEMTDTRTKVFKSENAEVNRHASNIEQPQDLEEIVKTETDTNKGTKTLTNESKADIAPKTKDVIKNELERENQSEESDDTSFRMMIYEKSKQQEACGEHSKSDEKKSDDVVTTLQRMKICNEFPESSLESAAPLADNVEQKEKVSASDSKDDAAAKENRSRRHKKEKSTHSRKRSSSRSSSSDSRKLEHNSSRRNESEFRDHRKHKSKHSHRRSYSDDSEYSDDDRSQRRSICSRRNRDRSHNRSYKGRYSEDDDYFERQSNYSKSGSRPHYHRKDKSKYSRRSDNSDDDFERKSNFSGQSRSQYRDREAEKRTKSSHGKTSRKSRDYDDDFKYKSTSSRRSHDGRKHESKYSRRKKFSDSENGSDSERTRLSQKSRKNQSHEKSKYREEDRNYLEDELILSKQTESDSKGELQPKSSHGKSRSMPRDYDDDFKRKSKSSRQSRDERKHESKYSRRERLNDDSEYDSDSERLSRKKSKSRSPEKVRYREEATSIHSKDDLNFEVETEDDRERKPKSTHKKSRRTSRERSDDYKHKSNSSRRSHDERKYESKHSRRRRYSDSENGSDSERTRTSQKSRKNRSHEKSKYREEARSHSEDELNFAERTEGQHRDYRKHDKSRRKRTSDSESDHDIRYRHRSPTHKEHRFHSPSFSKSGHQYESEGPSTSKSRGYDTIDEYSIKNYYWRPKSNDKEEDGDKVSKK